MSIPNYRGDFGPFGDVVWLNTAHQGALPRVAADTAHEAVSWKVTPQKMTTDRFTLIPQRLKRALGRLINAPPEEIILGNGNSYGLHLLANGIPWKKGDEVLLLKGDFPSTILPWLALEKRGVVVRIIEPRNFVLQPDEIEAQINASTRLICLTWVHSFSGHAVDLMSLGALCRKHGVTFVLNASQALGARPLDVQTAPVDAVTSVGWKWLCGPYATGFCWIRPELLEILEYNQAYWLAMQTADDLGKTENDYRGKDIGARRYDVFGTANFFNFYPWITSVEYVLDRDVEAIQEYDQRLVLRFIDGLNSDKYRLVSQRPASNRSTLVVFSFRRPEKNGRIYESLRQAGVYIALRRENLRVSPHLYNTEEDIDRALDVLNQQ